MLTWHRLLIEGHPRMCPESIGSLRTEQNWIGGASFGPTRRSRPARERTSRRSRNSQQHEIRAAKDSCTVVIGSNGNRR